MTRKCHLLDWKMSSSLRIRISISLWIIKQSHILQFVYAFTFTCRKHRILDGFKENLQIAFFLYYKCGFNLLTRCNNCLTSPNTIIAFSLHSHIISLISWVYCVNWENINFQMVFSTIFIICSKIIKIIST